MSESTAADSSPKGAPRKRGISGLQWGIIAVLVLNIVIFGIPRAPEPVSNATPRAKIYPEFEELTRSEGVLHFKTERGRPTIVKPYLHTNDGTVLQMPCYPQFCNIALKDTNEGKKAILWWFNHANKQRDADGAIFTIVDQFDVEGKRMIDYVVNRRSVEAQYRFDPATKLWYPLNEIPIRPPQDGVQIFTFIASLLGILLVVLIPKLAPRKELP